MPRAEQLVDHTELIKRTSTIVLAEVTKIEEVKAPNTKARMKALQGPIPARTIKKQYHFKAVEVLKGVLDKPAFIIEGSPDKSENETSFNNHSDAYFWSRTGGRVGNSADCEIHPKFELEKRYLIFLDKPYHRKSFERIDDPNDKWLNTVRELVKKSAKYQSKI